MNKAILNADIERGTISRHIYGHFAEHLGRCIYEGFWVGEDSPIENVHGIRKDVLEALRNLKVPVLRWPGGCFADEYHWKDGVGPRDKRKRMVNAHWGGVIESNHFGTHEFMLLCELLGCEPYICGNVGSGTVQEMREWIEYLTHDGESPMADWRRENGREEPWRLKYFGVGNEGWGCGGNMTAEYYAGLYRQYQTFLNNYGDNRLYKIACGPAGADTHWTEVMMREAAKFMDGISLHHYIVPTGDWTDKGSATEFDEKMWFETLRRTMEMDELIRMHKTIMDKYDPEKRIDLIVDEWGNWHNVEPGTHPRFLYQQNTLRDALVAGVHLNIFNSHNDRVHMANIAQTVNVLQSVILTEGERMVLTPTYHVFDMYKVHQDATRLDLELSGEGYEFEGQVIPKLSATASRDGEGRIHVTVCNLDHANGATLEVELRGVDAVKAVSGRLLTAEAMQAHNTFENPDAVKPVPFGGAQAEGKKLKADLPAKSVVLLTLEV